MKPVRSLILSLVLFGGVFAQVRAGDAPYRVTVWADVLFDPQGKAASVEVIDAKEHPKAFVDNLRQRFERAQIAPVTAGDSPATFRTGVAIDLTITPATSGASGSVAVDGLRMEPLPRRARVATYPETFEPGSGWQGEVRARCRVDVEGRCTGIAIDTVPGMPESARGFVRDTLKRWRFEPQRINDAPIETEVAIAFTLQPALERPEDFRAKPTL